jgi:hypothetical protein
MSVTVRYRKLKVGKRPYLDIYHEGDRIKETIDIVIKHGDPLRNEKLKLIEKIRSQKELELLTGEFEFERKKLDIDFIEYYEKFYDEYQGKDKRLVKYSLVKLKEMIGSSTFPHKKLNKEFSEKFAAYLRSPEGGLRGESVYNYLQKFKRVINQ